MRRLALIALLVALLGGVPAASAQRGHGHVVRGSCTWGASSIRATVANGHWTTSQPQVTGCSPA